MRLALGALVFAGIAAAESTPHDTRARVATFLGESLVIALATMALIQVARRLLPLRGWFHRDEVERWLGSGPAINVLEARLIGWRSLAALDLPVEQLCAQLSAIGDHLLEEVIASPPPANERNDAVELLDRMSEGEWSRPRPPSLKDSEEWETTRRTRVAYAIQRHLDLLQIEAGSRWRWSLLVAAIGACGVLFLVAKWVLGAGTFIQPWSNGAFAKAFTWTLGTLLVALLGGYMATIARDVVAIIEKLRR
jgi:hypothetical protein